MPSCVQHRSCCSASFWLTFFNRHEARQDTDTRGKWTNVQAVTVGGQRAWKDTGRKDDEDRGRQAGRQAVPQDEQMATGRKRLFLTGLRCVCLCIIKLSHHTALAQTIRELRVDGTC